MFQTIIYIIIQIFLGINFICLYLRYFKCLSTCDEVILKFEYILINVNAISCGIHLGCIPIIFHKSLSYSKFHLNFLCLKSISLLLLLLFNSFST
jgi:hypothetical protein